MINTELIKTKMREKGLTQNELAKRMGLDPATINRKINDSTGKNLSISEVKQLVKELDIPEEQVETIFFN